MNDEFNDEANLEQEVPEENDSYSEASENMGEASFNNDYMNDGSIPTGNSSFEQYKAKQEYYKREAEALKQRQQQLDERIHNRNKDKEEDPEKKENDANGGTNNSAEKSNDENKTENNSEKSNPNDESKTEKSDSSDEKKPEHGQDKDNKNGGKLGEKVDKARSKVNQTKQKINSAKQKAHKIAHPINSTKDKIKEEFQKKIKSFLLKWWWLVGIIAIIALLFILILLILIGDSDGDGELLLDPYYDFGLTMVNVTNDYTDEADKVELERTTLKDYLLGAAYYEFHDKLEGLTSSEELEVYKTFFVVAKSRLLAMGNYDVETKEITIKSGLSQMPYCNVYFGCKVVNNGGIYSYISSNRIESDASDIVSSIDPTPTVMLSLLSEAYNDTKYLLLVPKSFNDVLTKYSFEAPPYTYEIKYRWIGDSAKYDGKISNTPEYANFKIYNIVDYALEYEYATDTAYWWPIGSLESVHGSIYSGTPSAVYISSTYGPRTIQGENKYHHGIDIASAACEQNVIIATRSGEVIQVEDGCETHGYYGNSCNGGFGNYVKISHLDGYVSIYAHMSKNSISVRVGDHVTQGQRIGNMGSSGSSTGCHLHFAITLNGSYVNPLDFVSADNPRPTYNLNDPTFTNGSSNKQSVCLALRSTGFSDNAVAAIMTNIQAESGFNPQALGDHGTSYGLCQWHNGRYTNLQSYCGSDYTSVQCQLKYLLNELQNSYKSVYNMLLTNNSAHELASFYCINFEVPSNRYVNCPLRADKYAMQMLGYVTNGCR